MQRPLNHPEDIVGSPSHRTRRERPQPLDWIDRGVPLNAMECVDSKHFLVPQGKGAIELVAGKESALAQAVLAKPGGQLHPSSFAARNARNSR